MPHQFRTKGGELGRAGKEPIKLQLTNGTALSCIWGGSAQHENLATKWLNKKGHLLAQTLDEVSALAVRDEDTNKIRWGDAPPGAHLLFVIEDEKKGKDGHPYRMARLVTSAATPEEEAYFKDNRTALFAKLGPGNPITIIPPLQPPPPEPPAQGELF